MRPGRWPRWRARTPWCTGSPSAAPPSSAARRSSTSRVSSPGSRSSSDTAAAGRGPRVNGGTSAEPDHVTWWEHYIERPSGRRPRRTNRSIPPEPEKLGFGMDLQCPRSAQDLDHVVNGSVDVQTTTVAVLVTALRRQPDAPAAALRAGISDLVARALLPQQAATELLADRARFAAATLELSAFG